MTARPDREFVDIKLALLDVVFHVEPRGQKIAPHQGDLFLGGALGNPEATVRESTWHTYSGSVFGWSSFDFFDDNDVELAFAFCQLKAELRLDGLRQFET